MAHNHINCYFTWDMLRSIDLQCFCGQPSKLEEVRCSRAICTRALEGFLEGQGLNKGEDRKESRRARQR